MSVSKQTAIGFAGAQAQQLPLVLDTAPETSLEAKFKTNDERFAETPTILIVDHVESNRQRLKAMLPLNSYQIVEATRPSDAFEILEKHKIDLVIADFLMQEMNGPDFCRMLKKNRKTQLTPVLIVTSLQGSEIEIAIFDSGADEFLVKPLQPTLVRTRVRGLLHNKALTDSLDEAESILFALAQSVEQRDPHTGKHCERLAVYGVMLGKALGLSRRDQLALYRGGFLHDIGKVGIPDAILFKRGRLTEAEWETMRIHTTRGEEICCRMKTLAPVLPIIRSHHERWNGSGYPDGLRENEIPLLARILQVADIYDALTTARPYKPAYTPEHAVQVLLDETQRGWRDPELVALFADLTRKGLPEVAAESPSATGTRQSLDALRLELIR